MYVKLYIFKIYMHTGSIHNGMLNCIFLKYICIQVLRKVRQADGWTNYLTALTQRTNGAEFQETQANKISKTIQGLEE